MIIQDIATATDDALTFAISGQNFVISSSDPSNVIQLGAAAAGAGATAASANQVVIPISSVTGDVRFLTGGGTDTIHFATNLTLPGGLEVQTSTPYQLRGTRLSASLHLV